MEALFEVENVIFKEQIKYPTLFIALNEITFLRGESGCGKSTLFKLLNGIISPSYGTILFHGKNIQWMDTIELRRQVLLVNQNAYLFAGSIEDNFRMYYEYREEMAPMKEKMQEMLRKCCISFSLEHDCLHLSGGERQRIFMAICISFCPEVLLLDEPTSALDLETGRQMMQNIVWYCKENKITLMVVSHDPILAEKFADKVITLEERKQKE